MKTLYIDCTNGVCGDMLLKALSELKHRAVHETSHNHGRSFEEVKDIINNGWKYTDVAKKTALRIYDVIAKAEAKVHEQTLANVHFHEVGRDEAIRNALGIGAILDELKIDEIVTSPIYDGKGFVDCAHGRIPVPVPAVRAMMDECGKTYPSFEFRTCEDVETEMLTPSGLASIIGMGARPANSPGSAGGMMFTEGKIVAEAEAKGTRNTGRSGLKLYLIEK